MFDFKLKQKTQEDEKIKYINHLGSFAATLRKNKNTTNGVITQFFGEDGEDADIISVLSQTRFKGMEVFLDVYQIKNEVGLDMKDTTTNNYPKIASFPAIINRPKPSNNDDGLIAEFFVPDGKASDEANKLNQSQFKNALVFVDILSSEQNENDVEVNIYLQQIQNDIVEKHSKKLAEQERKEYQKKAKKFEKLNLILHESNIFLNKELIKQIQFEQLEKNKSDNKDNHYIDYNDFLLQQSCSFKHKGNKCKRPSNQDAIVSFNTNDELYKLPFCEEHKVIMLDAIEKNDFSCLDNKELYIDIEVSKNIKSWVWQYFINNFSLTGKEEPDSQLILGWFDEHNLRGILPTKFIKDTTKLAISNI